MICDTPSLRNLRREYPDQEIVFLVRNHACVDLMSKSPYVDRVIEMPHSRDDYDKYYEFLSEEEQIDALQRLRYKIIEYH